MTARASLPCALLLACLAVPALAAPLKLGIMEAQRGEASRFDALKQYLSTKGVDIEVVGFEGYSDAARQFAAGSIDAMFAGSGVAAAMIIKGLADPVARPLGVGGYSTYHAVIIALRGSPPFKGDPRYFAGKRVACAALASSGEIFLRALGKNDSVTAINHGAALDAVNSGVADVAVVKDRVWEKVRSRYPTLEQVGEDAGENPDNTLIASKKTPPALVERLRAALLSIKDDPGEKARAARTALGLTMFIPTSVADFDHTLDLLRRAGVTRDFDFVF
jgi:ABC-type phosphate/phosphonate transport system substrate-binding protein